MSELSNTDSVIVSTDQRSDVNINKRPRSGSTPSPASRPLEKKGNIHIEDKDTKDMSAASNDHVSIILAELKDIKRGQENLQKLLQSQVSALRSEMTSRIDNIKCAFDLGFAKIDDTIENIEERVQKLEEKSEMPVTDVSRELIEDFPTSRSIVLINLKVKNENLGDEVDVLISEGLKLTNVKAEKTERMRGKDGMSWSR